MEAPTNPSVHPLSNEYTTEILYQNAGIKTTETHGFIRDFSGLQTVYRRPGTAAAETILPVFTVFTFGIMGQNLTCTDS